MRIAFVTDELPREAAAGHLSYNRAIIDWLRASGHDVTILFTGNRLTRLSTPYPFPVAGPQIRQSRSGHILPATPRAAAIIAARTARRHLPVVRRPGGKKNAILGAFPSQADSSWCAAWIARAQPDALFIDTIFRTPVLHTEHPRSLMLAHDIFHHRSAALQAAGIACTPVITAAFEAQCAAKCAAIVAIQPEEASLFATELTPDRDVISLTMPVLPCPPPAGTARIARRLVFLGSATPPNIDGLAWFFADIWPALQNDNFTLDLVGDCARPFPRLPANVTALGRIDNIAPILHRAAAAISPLRAGSGLKVKMLDYARHGLVTVATQASLQGFQPGGPFLPARSAADFITALKTAATMPAQTGLDYIARHYMPGTAFAPLAALLKEGQGASPPGPPLGAARPDPHY
jgi:hypothetical protein